MVPWLGSPVEVAWLEVRQVSPGPGLVEATGKDDGSWWPLEVFLGSVAWGGRCSGSKGPEEPSVAECETSRSVNPHRILVEWMCFHHYT